MDYNNHRDDDRMDVDHPNGVSSPSNGCFEPIKIDLINPCLIASADGLKRIKLSPNPDHEDNQDFNHKSTTQFKSSSTESTNSKLTTESPSIEPLPGTAVSGLTRESWLLRLFESDLFDMSIAITYLYKSRDPGVLSYIGNRMFSFKDTEVDFYLFQLVTLYIHDPLVADSIHSYLLDRCKNSPNFSLQLVWLLNSFSNDAPFKIQQSSISLFKTPNGLNGTNGLSRKKSFGLKLKNLILAEEDCHGNWSALNFPGSAAAAASPFKKSHHRSYSDATCARKLSNHPTGHHNFWSPPNFNTTNRVFLSKTLGDLSSGRSFDNGCICSEYNNRIRQSLVSKVQVVPIGTDCVGLSTPQMNGSSLKRCQCGSPRLAAQHEFIKSLMVIGAGLQTVPSRDIKVQKLYAELSKINLNLPARVWLPIHTSKDSNHIVLRIPPGSAVLLNSKDRAPFLVYVEIMDIAADVDVNSAPLPAKLISTLRQTKSEENLVSNFVSNGVTAVNGLNGDTNGDHIPDEEMTEDMLVTREFTPTKRCDDLRIVPDQTDHKPAQTNGLNGHSEPIVNGSKTQSKSSSFKMPSSGKSKGELKKKPTGSSKIAKNGFIHDTEDPSVTALKEPWESKVGRIRSSSPYGHLKGWRLCAAIIKSGDDLRQELMSYQFLLMLKKIWQMEHVPLWIRPYKIVVLSPDSGMIEPILNSVSLHQIKKNDPKISSLYEYFLHEFGTSTSSESFLNAQRNFVQSCAAYCIVSYLIQVKDRLVA